MNESKEVIIILMVEKDVADSGLHLITYNRNSVRAYFDSSASLHKLAS